MSAAKHTPGRRPLAYYRARQRFLGLVIGAHTQIEHARELRQAGHQDEADFVMECAASSRRHAAEAAAIAKATGEQQ